MPLERLPHEQNFVYSNPRPNVIFNGPVPADPDTVYGDEEYNPVNEANYYDNNYSHSAELDEEPEEEYEDCDGCDGAGTVVQDCPECHGSGEIEDDCGDCDGEGTVPVEIW